MSDNKKFWGGLACGLLLAVIVAGSVYSGKNIVSAWKNRQDTGTEESTDHVVNLNTMQKLQVVKQIVENNYALDMVDDETMESGIYEGLVGSLGDPYSDYFTKKEMDEQSQKMEGVYYGIGAYITYDEVAGFARLGDIFPGSPAEESGLQKGDLIIKIDGEYAKGMELSDVVSRIKGEEGTKVTITILRNGETDYRDVEVERRQVPNQTVNFEMLGDGIAYIQIKEFDDVTVDQFTEALATAKGSGMLGLVLDLRNNPGGNLGAVTDIARKILPEGIIVYTEDKAGKRVDYTCDGKNELTVPLVVLVNGGSASASEILAGAVKDYDKGTLLGTTTFGKGIVQKYIGISDGSAVKLTVSKYYTPKGNNIHGIGIEPDEELELDYEDYFTNGKDNQLDRAVELLKTGE